ncbi:MAG TPA: BON domain-containing protein [Steroidobacteraceae bacterium]|nr:BON domain-containing protein [Steroidobacteraceae bacterium]
MMRSDIEIKRDIEAELKWSPEVDETDVAVQVTDGVAALTGYLPNGFQRHQAETAAKRVAGVRAVANDIVVRLPAGLATTDPQVAREVVAALQRDLPSVCDRLTALVDRGYLTLEGTLEWQYQRDDAEATVRRVRGVVGVRNSIVRQPTLSPSDVKRKIEDAFRRSAALDVQRITVEAEGSEVILRGKVRSWSERGEAEQAAWSAPGVVNVRNELIVGL